MNKPRGRPFEPGNRYGKGRPKGSRNKTTVIAQQILDQYAESLISQGIILAGKGNAPLVKLFLEHILPVRRDNPVRLKLPEIETVRDLGSAGSVIVKNVASGKITPQEADKITDVLEKHRKGLETAELLARLERLERIEDDRRKRGGD
jgi:hypothetical protein